VVALLERLLSDPAACDSFVLRLLMSSTTATALSDLRVRLRNEQPWGRDRNAPVKVLLERLGFDDSAEEEDFVAHLAMLLLPGGSKLPLSLSAMLLTLLVAIRPLPFARTSFQGAVGVVVVWIRRPAASILRPLFAFELFRLHNFSTELGKQGNPLRPRRRWCMGQYPSRICHRKWHPVTFCCGAPSRTSS
jgi:hypothetical protein